MAKQKTVGRAAAKVKLKHPETSDVHEFTLEHAQRIMDYQTKRNPSVDKSWTLVDSQDYSLKDGKIISGTANGDNK